MIGEISPEALLLELSGYGVMLSIEGDELRTDGPLGRLTPELRQQLESRQSELVTLLSPEKAPGSPTKARSDTETALWPSEHDQAREAETEGKTGKPSNSHEESLAVADSDCGSETQPNEPSTAPTHATKRPTRWHDPTTGKWSEVPTGAHVVRILDKDLAWFERDTAWQTQLLRSVHDYRKRGEACGLYLLDGVVRILRAKQLRPMANRK